MQGGGIGKTEALELPTETHEAALANLDKPSETMAERLKRKYTKSSK